MKIFERFRKKTDTTTTDMLDIPTDLAEELLPAGSNFIDDLVSYFTATPEITAAFFGFAYDQATRKHLLVLAIDHMGDEEAVQQLTWMIKSTYMSDTEIYYASRHTNQDLVEYIRQHNAPFFSKGNPQLLQQQIMKQWFDEPTYRQELIDTLQTYELFTLAHKVENSKDLMLATYKREEDDFIPLFSLPEMIGRSGMINVPDDRVLVKMTLRRILGGINPGQLFILNPSTPFEVTMKI
ncbi:enhanced serine sensitivity protein SseB C-terminal domain-containing protein [Chitinophaga rhizophila]|uniref:Enhanced serine sensitivity protein SseB C-terminal domain-containing protein n=1 Tax=Chitinophaga rhizophila TaxID=2866212 RepID=A0ABS7GJJ5_9BACT|nr:enhanced serine sensitivity protein SseB C-terminal domain-containing protein [Chitinophaga rhizophila]MBW8687290.1 enhanced serine sensitivity protein SseB C-terminal domain-containing protein [Chitinophaga rhizophila]